MVSINCNPIPTKFSQSLWQCKNTRCYAEIWSKATYKNELSKKNFSNCLDFAPGTYIIQVQIN